MVMVGEWLVLTACQIPEPDMGGPTVRFPIAMLGQMELKRWILSERRMQCWKKCGARDLHQVVGNPKSAWEALETAPSPPTRRVASSADLGLKSIIRTPTTGLTEPTEVVSALEESTSRECKAFRKALSERIPAWEITESVVNGIGYSAVLYIVGNATFCCVENDIRKGSGWLIPSTNWVVVKTRAGAMVDLEYLGVRKRTI